MHLSTFRQTRILTMKKIVLTLAAVALLTSCSVTKTGTAKSIDITGAGVIHTPVTADLEVDDQKASHTITLKKVENKTEARNTAIRELLALKNADVLVEPTYTTETSRGKTKLTVTGWPARYVNFRKMTEEDRALIEFLPQYKKAESSQPATSNFQLFKTN